MRAVVIHNPSAGTHPHQLRLQTAVEVLRAAGWETSLAETATPGDATRLARRAADAGVEAVFAVGGDGTLNEVLNGVLGSETAVGVLPLGTANVWALEMGLPLNNLARAAALQARAPTRKVDVGIAEGMGFGPRAFILSCGAGFDADVVHQVERQRAHKRRLGKILFIAVGVWRALAFRGRRVTVRVDGETFRRRVLLALTSNTQLYGAALRVPPDARVDDGLLDVTLLHGENALHTAWHFLRLGVGMYEMQPDIEHLRGARVEIWGATLPIHVDAEPVGNTPVNIHVSHCALKILVPETARREIFSTPPNSMLKPSNRDPLAPQLVNTGLQP